MMAGPFDRAAILESFLKELSAYLPEIETNLDRVQRQPGNNEALEEIYRRAHTIAGSAAMMELSGMAQIATGIETLIGDALDGLAPLNEGTIALIRRSVQRLRRLMDLVRVGGDDSAIVAQDQQDYAASRPRTAQTGPTPTPRAFGGPGAPSGGVAPPTPAPPPHPEYLPTAPLNDDLAAQGNAMHAPAASVMRLGETPLWRDIVADEESLRSCAGGILQSIGALRGLGRSFDGERNELMAFLDGSQDALDRLEQWAGQAMGIDLRTSPDHVRRYLPLSVLWVVTAHMKSLQEQLQESTRGLTVQHESLGEVLGNLHAALDRLGQLAGGMVTAAGPTADGGFAATVTQYSWMPPAQAARQIEALRPAERADLERAVREELRREIEDEVRIEVAALVRREEERRLRQEIEIQVRRQMLAGLSPSLATGNAMSSDLAILSANRPPAPPRRVEAMTQSSEAIEAFHAEAEEHLHTIAAGLATLEQHPNDADAVRAIRRAVHTLKGAAAITGFTAVANLAHQCEDLLDRLGDGTVAMTPEAISLLLDTSQALESLISGDTAEQGGATGLMAALRPRYQALLGETVELEATPPRQPAVQAPAPVAPVLVTAGRDDDELESGEASAEARAAAAGLADAGDLSVRLPLRKLDELIAIFGDILVNRSIIEERSGRLTRMINETSIVSDHLRDVGLRLERQLEATLLPSRRGTQPGLALPPSRSGGAPTFGGPNVPPPQADFDPLEMDRYSDLHQLLRGLSEGTTDAAALSTEMETTVRELEVALARESRLSSTFQDALLKARLVRISSLMPRLYRAVRAVALKYGKEFEMFIEGDDTELDRNVYEEITAPLLHLVRNAIYHGIEPVEARASAGKPKAGTIVINAHYEGSQLVISVRDDGAGINSANIRSSAVARGLIDAYTHLSDREIINLIFQPGFSTSGTVTEEGGRGIGLDVVRDTVSRLRGTVEVDSVIGRGTTFTMKIPITLQIQHVVLVRAGNQTFAVPMSVVEQLGQLDFFPRVPSENGQALDVRGERYHLVHLATYLGGAPTPIGARTPVMLVRAGGRHWALMADAVSVQPQEIVAKSLGPHLRNVPCVTGATVLGTGQVVLILDPTELVQRAPRTGGSAPVLPDPGAALPAGELAIERSRRDTRPHSMQSGPLRSPFSASTSTPGNVPYILVVDDSPSVRRVVSATLRNAGWDVMTARDGVEALEIVAQRTPVAILLDIEMPRMDGYELMGALRRMPGFEQLPLIVLTSRAATKHQQRALQLGADAYVVKPYQDDQLLGTINELVRVQPTGEPR
jgi:chemotaxis protein histidine kinase CheA/ActR/RegA family two-component response regulator